MDTTTKADFTKKQLQALADFWPVFANPKFVYETEDEHEKRADGVIVMPSSTLSSEAYAFHMMVYREGWILKEFDWLEWARTDEFNNLFSKKGAVAKASVQQLAQLLTTLVRKERFCSGTMACAYSDGLLTGITQRASMFL
jgi:Family of unknown function (DUF6508)